MSKNILAFCAVIMSVFFLSCKKESSQPSNGDIIGTWTFASMDVSSTTTAQYTDGFGTTKTVSTSNYTTKDNQGTVTFDASKITSNNLSYSVSTVVSAKTYQDNILIGSTSAPFNYTSPASSGSATYKTVSADSIYFDGGSLFMNGITTEVTPSGAKLDLQGNTLYMTQYVNQTTTEDFFGILITSIIDAEVVVKLQK